MPFTPEQAVERLKKTYKNVSATMSRQFTKVFNNILKDTGDESRAFAGAYAAINKRGVGKKEASIREVMGGTYHCPTVLAVIMAKYTLETYEIAGDKVAEVTGGTAKVWGHDSLLIEDAGPGLHISFLHHGEVLELEAGNGHPSQMVSWLENRVMQMVKDDSVDAIDTDQVAADPFAFAEFMTAVFQSAGIRARTHNSKSIVAGRRDVVVVIEALFDRRAREAVQAYFSESGGATDHPKGADRPTSPEEEPEGNEEGEEPSEDLEDLGDAPEENEEAYEESDEDEDSEDWDDWDEGEDEDSDDWDEDEEESDEPNEDEESDEELTEEELDILDSLEDESDEDSDSEDEDEDSDEEPDEEDEESDEEPDEEDEDEDSDEEPDEDEDEDDEDELTEEEKKTLEKS